MTNPSFLNASANCLLPRFRSRKKMCISGCWGVPDRLFNLRYLQSVVLCNAFDSFSRIEAAKDDFSHNAGPLHNWSTGRNCRIDHNQSRWIDREISRPAHPHREEFNRPTFVVPFYPAKVEI